MQNSEKPIQTPAKPDPAKTVPPPKQMKEDMTGSVGGSAVEGTSKDDPMTTDDSV